ncbi:putative dna damage response protein [Daldinia childiae]|uniref:putative dna damage response protein n=1 Tax=Daldinia childiae TaxID=326645 RepID=UPI0014468691|nr:putative dna damage response protein [Daldinia childiae]KAF3069768.1 putative dna damage response protein [Daldinia childiae]
MWLLENEGEALEGKRLWLRPGKRYLFGRTVAEPGQLAIRGEGAERVSRKHVTIQVDEVTEGDGENVSSRSRITVEDLGSKGGTRINDEKIKGETRVLSRDVNTLQMGTFPPKFRITWFPVALSFSFTANQLRADPLSKLREDLEQLDVKFLAHYDVQSTTHVVSKKRNVPKGLQALVNGRYLVTEGFYSAIITAATPGNGSDGATASALESDFDANWPDAMQYIPPPGDEAVPRPVEAFAPNTDRAEIFYGYTFIFYNRKQYDNLLEPITNGRGKALFNEVVEGETQIDDFIRYVKGVAGEKGMGEFKDGSEGKGVVVVRWIPSPPQNADWFADFYRSVSLRLDHRLIDQKDFLDAILNNDASILRRPLEAEAEPQTSQIEPQRSDGQAMDVDEDEPSAQPQKQPLRRRARGAVKSRFKGFGVDLEDDDTPEVIPTTLTPSAGDVEPSQEGLFVSQDVASQEPEQTVRSTRQSQRKRRTPPLEPQDTIDYFAPTAAQVKRRRIAAGEDPVPRKPTPEEPVIESQKLKARAPKIKKEIDILNIARQHREEAEARAKAEREELATAPEGLDLAEIRRLHIEEPMELRQVPPIRTRDQDIADGRWDPAWNGRKNFKKFQSRVGPRGRAPQRIIVALEEVKSKGFGIGDDYWLEDESQQRRREKQSQTHSQSQSTGEREDRQTINTPAKKAGNQRQKLSTEVLPPVDSSEDDDYGMDGESEEAVIAPPSRTRTNKLSQQTSQSQSLRSTPQSTAQKTQSLRTSKRAAPPPAKEQPAKRSRIGFVAASDDESDDGLRFRFGKR